MTQCLVLGDSNGSKWAVFRKYTSLLSCKQGVRLAQMHIFTFQIPKVRQAGYTTTNETKIRWSVTYSLAKKTPTFTLNPLWRAYMFIGPYQKEITMFYKWYEHASTNVFL